MIILFRTKKLEKLCNSIMEAQKKWGTECGELIMQRLDEIDAVDNLEDLRKVHQRCHPLKGDRKGQWSVDVKQPYRLFFEPANEPLPKCDDGSLNTAKVTAITVLEVGDPHG